MKIIKGGITSAKGFKAGAVSCGIKRSGRNDFALLYSTVPCVCAGTFTTNRVRSGSVEFSERLVRKGLSQAIAVNSGNANCCVGKNEIKHAKDIASLTARKLGLKGEKVLIASTGIIGRPLPVAKIKKKIPLLVKDLNKVNGTGFAKAIMTTDTVHKEIAVKINIGKNVVTIGGAAKGSGMICPNMATMLAFVTTDASIEKNALQSSFKECVSDSFNRITVDGDMSTNDTAIIFASGLALNKKIKKDTKDYFEFLNALKFVLSQLAKKIVLDGEGATRFVEISVTGAMHKRCAEVIARHVADSNLIKTMIAGGDPNWGRVAGSVGSSNIAVKQGKVDIYFGNKLVMKSGAGTKVSRKALVDLFKKKEIVITIDLKSGKNSFKVWTCDLTEKYVEINAEYET